MVEEIFWWHDNLFLTRPSLVFFRDNAECLWEGFVEGVSYTAVYISALSSELHAHQVAY